MNKKQRYRTNIFTVTTIILDGNTKEFKKHYIEACETEEDALNVIKGNINLVKEYNENSEPLWKILVCDYNGKDTDNGKLFLSTININNNEQRDIYLEWPEFRHY
uniref:Uncharacterized protein n=1 Tax=Spiroplasma kunkelii CR2-3x TaxID=273035 RepID=Q5VCC2_SPIKU|nr:hypothetical protein [Spiroplasma kunkelii]AAS59578.1 hypothetical protein SKUN_p0070 [Spiroplasma kunkelii CR2-3x]